MLINKALLWGQKQLTGLVERPRLEAEILLSHMLGVSREILILHNSKEIDFESYKILINRRLANEPIEYITKRVSFWDFELFIDKGALIPRPESEILVEKAIELIKKHNIKRVAEIGIGSGALSIAIAKECDVFIEASDISLEAIKLAKRNIKDFKLEDKIKLYHCSMLDCIETPQLLISNPPYIDPEVKLESNVVEYEPHAALFAPKKGLKILYEILELIKEKNINFAVCEMGYDQKAPLQKYANMLGLTLEFYKDLAKLDRGFVYKRG